VRGDDLGERFCGGEAESLQRDGMANTSTVSATAATMSPGIEMVYAANSAL